MTDTRSNDVAIREIVTQISATIGHCDEIVLLSNRSGAHQNAIEAATVSIDAAVSSLAQLRLDMQGLRGSQAGMENNVQQLEASLSVLQANAVCRLNKLRELDAGNQQRYNVELNNSGARGRPSVVISEEQLISLRQLNFKWIQIAKMLGISLISAKHIGVSKNTVYRRRAELNLTNENDPARIPTDEELDVLVSNIKRESPGNIGSSMIAGALRANGYFVHRTRVYHSLKRTDPVGMAVRRRVHIRRRQYWVPGPGSLWHVDTNHKLSRRYGIVVHGGVDGYTRAIVFMHASSNNRAETMLEFFLAATRKWNWPSRLRTDRGTENVEIARAMIERRGPNRGSHIPGPSVHNQRIERHWRDARLNVLQGFMDLFAMLESTGDLDIGAPLDLLALQYVFIPRLNELLRQVTESWNQHPLSSEHNLSPYQMYVEGVLRLYNSQYTAIRDILDDPGEQAWDDYGIDDIEDHEVNDNENGPVVNEAPSSLTVPESRLLELMDLVDPLATVDDCGVELYLRAKQFLEQHA